jgi:hypothetical protein
MRAATRERMISITASALTTRLTGEWRGHCEAICLSLWLPEPETRADVPMA